MKIFVSRPAYSQLLQITKFFLFIQQDPLFNFQSYKYENKTLDFDVRAMAVKIWISDMNFYTKFYPDLRIQRHLQKINVPHFSAELIQFRDRVTWQIVPFHRLSQYHQKQLLRHGSHSKIDCGLNRTSVYCCLRVFNRESNKQARYTQKLVSESVFAVNRIEGKYRVSKKVYFYKKNKGVVY